MFRSRDHVKKFVDYMHTQHFNMRFTFKIEDQNSFSFLDIEIISNTEKRAFETSVYRKSTFNGVLPISRVLSLLYLKLGCERLLFFNMLFL